MIPTTVAATTFGFIILTLIGYLLAAREGRRRKIAHPDDYFLARGRMTGDDLGDTQIAYALQMSTVYPFFMLAAAGAWMVPVLNSLMWLAGIWWFYAYLPRFRPLLGKSKTIHDFIGRNNDSQGLRVFASAMSVIAFAGVIIFEIAYGSAVFRVLFGDSRLIYYVIVASLAAYLTTYIWNGGQTATMRTEQFQLVLAYVGLHLAVAHMFSSHAANIGAFRPTFIPVLVVLLSLWMLWSRGRSLLRAARARRWFISTAYVLVIASLSALLISIGSRFRLFSWQAFIASDPSVTAASRIDFWMMMGTAALLPIAWQFVDLSNWQRICSLTAVSEGEYEAQARRGFLEYLIESPLSWLLAVLLGILAPLIPGSITGTGDAFESFILHFLAEPGTSWIIGALLVGGIVGVFMSTADSAITAIGYAFAYDLWRPTRHLIDQPVLDAEGTRAVVNAGRWFMGLVVAAVVGCFILVDFALQKGQSLIGLLFAFYTPIVALAPAAIVPIRWRRRPSRLVAFAAIAAGAGAGLGLGIVAAVWRPDLQWYPAPVAFVASWVIYLGGMVLRRYPVEAEQQPQPLGVP